MVEACMGTGGPCKGGLGHLMEMKPSTKSHIVTEKFPLSCYHRLYDDHCSYIESTKYCKLFNITVYMFLILILYLDKFRSEKYHEPVIICPNSDTQSQRVSQACGRCGNVVNGSDVPAVVGSASVTPLSLV